LWPAAPNKKNDKENPVRTTPAVHAWRSNQATLVVEIKAVEVRG